MITMILILKKRIKRTSKTSEAVNNSFDIYKVDIENSDKLRNFLLPFSKDYHLAAQAVLDIH